MGELKPFAASRSRWKLFRSLGFNIFKMEA